jgi:DNA adenine methylase
VIQNVKKGDLVFLDPPYTVTHNSNGFIQYNQKIFSLSEQYKLSEMIDRIKDIGAYYILTNAAHPEVKSIFQKDDPIFEVNRSSTIGGIGSKRGKYAELIMTNC